MRRGRRGLVIAVWLASPGLVPGCGAEDQADHRDRETLVVELAVSPDGIEIRTVEPLSRRRVPIHREALTTLEYRLSDRDGEVVVQGRMPDFRWARSEASDPVTGAMSRRDVRFLAGVGRLRLPAVPGELVVLEPRAGGAVELGRAAFDPEARASELRRRPLDDDEVLGHPILIAGGGAKDGAIDVLLLPEAYKEEQLTEFHQEAAWMAEQLIGQADFHDYRDRLNVWYVDVRSKDDELDEDGWFGDDHDTAFDGEWGGGGFLGIGDVDENQVTYGDGDQARELGDAHDMDMVVMVANADGVRGMFHDDMISIGRDASGLTLAHELGHAILDLGDEYVEDLSGLEGFRCGAQSFLGLHERANVRTTVLDLGWWDLLTPGVELPTTNGDHDTVGAFEGANHCESGWYRPQLSCLMSSTYAPMCAVCRRELDRFMDGLAVAPPSCPEYWRGDGMCDLCLEDDPDCEVATVCDTDGVCDPKEHCSACPEDCGDCPIIGGCGDGACALNETDSSCPVDCGCAAGAQCSNGPAPYGCYCDAACEPNGDCCADVDLDGCSDS